MRRRMIVWAATLAAVLCGATSARAGEAEQKRDLAKELWPVERIRAALAAVEQQRKDGLLSDAAYQKRKKMLEDRLAGRYIPEVLAVTDPPLNFVQNAGFEKINQNSAKKRSRWLWWRGWDWGGDYENFWEQRPDYVHSGQYSAGIRCTGQKGRIGIFTPGLPAVPGAQEYTLTFWAKGEGDNFLFVNFEGGASAALRQKIEPEWRLYTLAGKPIQGKDTYNVYFYAIGLGTIWLDDVTLVPVGGTLDE